MKNKTIQTLGLGMLAAGLFAVLSVQASSLSLNFSSAGGTILDTNGVGTGFTARMPGTGAEITGNDTNLLLNTGAGVLKMTTSPGADINGQVGMSLASVVGVNLSSLGFDGGNDFTATANFINLTNRLLFPDQLCLVVGTDSANGVRAGFINFSQFHGNGASDANEGFGVLTSGGSDAFPRFFGTTVGGSMTVVISRIGGVWSVKVNGVDRMPNSNANGTGTPQPPTFLDSASDLFVGVVAMDVGNNSAWNVNLDTFAVSVSGNSPPSIASQPQKQLVNEGNPMSFSVTPADSTKSPIFYQWYRNNNSIADQTNSTLAMNPSAADAGNYTVLITNSLGSITSSIAQLRVILPSGTLSVDFNSAAGGIFDTTGTGIGLPARLGGTGTALPPSDTNLFLNTAAGTLEITTTSSDYNGGGGLDVNESLGVQLSSLGFTGSEDLNVVATFPLPFPDTASFDQFGIVVGRDSLAHTRAGSITFAAKERYSESVQTNEFGVPVNDGSGQYFGFGFNAGIPMTVLITRTLGVWHYYVDGVPWDVFTQPTFLNSTTDLFAGVFAMDVVNGVHKTISVDSFQARVFPGPKLNIVNGGGNLTLTWNVAGAGLESNTNLINPAGWVAIPGATNSPYVIPVPTSGNKYYRIAL